MTLNYKNNNEEYLAIAFSLLAKYYYKYTHTRTKIIPHRRIDAPGLKSIQISALSAHIFSLHQKEVCAEKTKL